MSKNTGKRVFCIQMQKCFLRPEAVQRYRERAKKCLKRQPYFNIYNKEKL